ncbi:MULTISPECIES: ArsR/SmtB family transcription factor [Nocardiopsis]|uniref:ArsR family transcriptional regulator n=1 Tax=Nocardiopsis sinuspersici TaxID=501010 RepID=A0A1V3C2X9_9ACTN|nr:MULTISPECIES: metalloregulator ArsR/SmtB family transcription factor [Nocardiopsis]OOC54998.1 ArsR family transcriptional regulator [Nocardiopsis sinuspersici]
MTDFPEAPIYEHLARLGKVLSAPVRLRLLDLLDQGECTVEELAQRGGLPLKNTSAHLQQLRAAGLVATRREGTRIHYSLRDREVSGFLGRFQEFAEERMSDLRAEIEEHLGRDETVGAVTGPELEELLRGGEVVLVDLRSPEEYEEDHVPGAVSIPSRQLEERLDELPWDMTIVAYCQGPYCVVSPRAVRVLNGTGRQARSLRGGYVHWKRRRDTG